MPRSKPLKARGLICPNGIYIAHMVVPADVRHVFGKSEFRRNLKTDNATIAARESEQCRAEWKSWIADARAGRSPETIKAKVDAWKQSLDRSASDTVDLSTLLYLRLAGSGATGLSPIIQQLGLTDSQQARLTVAKALADVEQSRLYARQSDDALAALNAVSAMAGEHEREAFGVEASRQPATLTGWSLDQLWRQASATKTYTASQTAQASRCLTCLKDFMGGDFDLGAMSKPKAVEFMTMVADYPARRTADMNSQRFTSLVRKARADALPGLSPSTQKLWRNFYWGLFNKAVQQDILAKNPFDAVQIAGVHAITGEPLDADQLARLFSQDRLATRDGLFWITVSGLCTGCRIGELATARRDEFIQADDEWFFDLRKRSTTKGDPRRVKNLAAKRLVPLHRQLVAMGFIEWLGDQDPARPFRNQGKTYSQSVSGLMRSAGITKSNGRNNTFHGLRHTLKRACRDAGLDEQISDLITGHSNGSVGRGYGAGANPATLATGINKVRFACLSEV